MLVHAGIPINGTLLPALQGFEMTPGIEMGYSDETDFFCTGSSTSKPVCQLYGNAKASCRSFMPLSKGPLSPGSKGLLLQAQCPHCKNCERTPFEHQ